MRRAGHLVVMLTALLGALGGCTAAAIEDKLPSSVGLPADAPARPATPYEYPAVHDMPPPRSDTPLTEDEQIRLQKELTTLRDKQEGLNAEAVKPKPAAKQKKKPLAGLSKAQTRGGGDNP